MVALVLDFGGVVTRTLFETHDETERALGLTPGTLTWRGPFDPESDALWQRMQRGEISERHYWLQRAEETGRLIGQEWTAMSDLLQAARSASPMAIIRPEALAAIDAAQATGARLAIASNELDLFYGPEFRHGLPFLSRFDVIVDGTYTDTLKPDPEVYQLVCRELDLAPHRCVFVDDQPTNVAGARASGMSAVQFDVANPAIGFDQALTRLRALSQTPDQREEQP